MRRREVIAGISAAAAWAGTAGAQQPGRVRHIGVLLFADQDRAVIAPLFQELQAMGYVDGKTVTIEYRDGAGDYERLPKLAAELVGLKPDVIFSFSGELAPIVKNATSLIPIVVVVATIPQVGSSKASRGRVEILLASLMYTISSPGRRLNYSTMHCPRSPVLPFCGIPITTIQSFEKPSARRAYCRYPYSPLRLGSRRISKMPSRMR